MTYHNQHGNTFASHRRSLTTGLASEHHDHQHQCPPYRRITPLPHNGDVSLRASRPPAPPHTRSDVSSNPAVVSPNSISFPLVGKFRNPSHIPYEPGCGSVVSSRPTITQEVNRNPGEVTRSRTFLTKVVESGNRQSYNVSPGLQTNLTIQLARVKDGWHLLATKKRLEGKKDGHRMRRVEE